VTRRKRKKIGRRTADNQENGPMSDSTMLACLVWIAIILAVIFSGRTDEQRDGAGSQIEQQE